ncbi:MAG: hypothetical protein JWN78_18 [Bacteroidota bacterium]|nr:hypothetical protein [Bacteroidota bacterium]
MKETRFIEQNRKKWKEFEDLSRSKHKDSNLYSKLFIQITDDLSYARTFYANRSVRLYLNNLAQDIFHKIFGRNRKKQSLIKDFWMEELPSIMYHHRIDLLISFIVLMVAIAIGLLTFYQDPDFANKILGDGYVAMTAENIAKKDPMAVYKQTPPIEMFVQIVYNNLRVDIETFFSGLVFSIGSLLVLLYNGIMLSAFQFYFIKRGLFRESFLAVWLHGTLEISAMVICGAAGIVLGKGVVFPGTYSRTQAFFSSAQRATKIFFSVLPITLTAGIIESFLTRYTKAPDALRLALIIVSLFFILGYYVYLPWLKKRNGTLRIPEAEKVLPEKFERFEFFQIKKVSEIILDTFRVFRKYTGYFGITIFWSAIIFTCIGLSLNKHYLLEDIYYTEWTFVNLKHYFTANELNWFTAVIPNLLLFISLQVCYLFYIEQCQQGSITPVSFYEWMKAKWKPVIINLLIQIVFYSLVCFFDLSVSILLFLLPLQFIGTFVLFFPYHQPSGFVRSFFKSLSSGVINLLAIHIGFLLLSLAFFFLISTSVFWLIYQAVAMNLTNDIINSDTVYLLFFLIAVTSIITLSFIFFCLSQGIFYFSQKEKHTAEGLISELDNLGNSPRRNVLQK